jgi:curved DNA-binding protein CbpA
MSTDDIDKIAELDLYEILDVETTATKKEIKKSFKGLVKRLHPDKKNGDAEAFEYINLAYTILTDEETREIYDAKRKEFLQSQQFDTMKDAFKTDLKEIEKSFKSEPESKKDFAKLTKNLDKKHGFDESKMGAMGSDMANRRMQELTKSRNSFEKDVKENTEELHLSGSDFNQTFLDKNSSDLIGSNIYDESNDGSQNHFSSDIVAFNQDSGMDLTKYNSINNFELYSSGASTVDYSSIGEAFDQSVPQDVINSYGDHNVVSQDSKKLMEQRMAEYQDFTQKMKDRSLEEINRPLTQKKKNVSIDTGDNGSD